MLVPLQGLQRVSHEKCPGDVQEGCVSIVTTLRTLSNTKRGTCLGRVCFLLSAASHLRLQDFHERGGRVGDLWSTGHRYPSVHLKTPQQNACLSMPWTLLSIILPPNGYLSCCLLPRNAHNRSMKYTLCSADYAPEFLLERFSGEGGVGMVTVQAPTPPSQCGIPVPKLVELSNLRVSFIALRLNAQTLPAFSGSRCHQTCKTRWFLHVVV